VIFLKRTIIKCPYCGAHAVLRPASVVHGEKARDEYLYICSRYPKCDAYVTAHKQSRQPMGALADGSLRRKRIQAHRAFDQLWRGGIMQKWQAYKWMQAKFGLNCEQAHIANFSEYRCDELIAMCELAMENIRKAA
jgi:ssDNA-binding Zn-finger/Zn-ribbon topoisomerase 1